MLRRSTRLARLLFAVLMGSAFLLSAGPAVPTAAKSAGDSRFGLDFVSPPSKVGDDPRFGAAMTLGVGWDRFPLYWSSMQPNAGGPIDFGGTDATIGADLSHGLQVDAILVGAPSWATNGDGVDLTAWSSFVGQTVAHYQGKVHHWEMWNEPDLLNGQGQGQYWPWGVPAYYQLLKAGYLAAKAADPTVTVILGGLAFPYNNQDFFPNLLAQITADPTAAANHGYFDVLAFHSYDRVARMYQLPLGYLGQPSFTGFRPLLNRAGLNPPIWVNELGVPVWDYGSGQNAPGRARQDEQASYVVESLADGFAAGIDRMFVFQLYDDGAGAVDPRTNMPAEFFGLFANDGTPRPAYGAYQTAINLFGGASAVTHWTLDRGPSYQNHAGIEVVTFYGTSRGKVTVAWNDDPGDPVSVALPTTSAAATQLDKLGNTVGNLTPVNGALNASLPGATNNNNFDCFTPHGCDPNDYIIGGSPVILVENDQTVPAVVLDPLPYDSIAPVHVSWHGTQPLPAGTTYDVQYRDAADGTWHDWLVGTNATSGTFGDGSMQLQSGHSYEFRARAHDATGALAGGQDYPVRPLASTLIVGGNVVRPPAALDARIEIVWPQNNLPVDKATKANITAALFQHGTTVSVNPNFTGTLQLWAGLNSDVGQPVATGKMRIVQAGNLKYPLWDFDDVDVSAARNRQDKYYFWVTVDGQRTNPMIWSHGADARTYFPQQDVPTGVTPQPPAAVDAKIEIVWPHDNLPVGKATLANVSVDLFDHGTTLSVAPTYSAPVRLYRAIDNGPLQAVATGDRVVQTRNGVTYPVWQFNDVDVSAAQDPQHRVYFWVEVVGPASYSNVWTHGTDARTYAPKQDVPTAVAQ